MVAPLGASIYIVVGDTILWLGGPAEPMHPRAILLSEPPAGSGWLPGATIRFPPCDHPAWWPEPALGDASSVATLRRGVARLAAAATSLGHAEGFGARLAGAPLAFPLARAAAQADALAAACAADAPARAADAARALLGLGSGLTPSGDDFVGGAFFARALFARAGVGDAAGWRTAAETIASATAHATHPISAALLIDLLGGEGWAPLHDLARALAQGDEAASMAAAQRLVRLGHSTGWDVLAGFVAGAAPTAPLLH